MASKNTAGLGPDIEGLKNFLEVFDRDKAMFFVGRDAEIAAIEKTNGNAFTAFKRGERASSMTLLFQGAPGAGKTSLLSHLIDRWSKSGSPIKGLWIDHETLAEPELLTTAILKSAGENTDKVFRQSHSTSTEYGGGFSVASIRHERETTPELPIPSLTSIAESCPPDKWSCPLCLMVDEVQMLDPQDHGRTLIGLHGGNHGLPIVPIYVGLGDSREKLGECGLTRFSHGNAFDIGA